ncbi:MAG: hypothetical protein RR942_05190 [Romboutsia sp.]
MEIVFIIVACVLTFIFIKFLLKKLLTGLFILSFAGIISFVYKVNYSISVLLITMLIFSANSIFSEVKRMGSNIIKSHNLYLNGGSEKMVNLLFSINYIVFMSICYIVLVRMSFNMIDTIELGIAFCLTWSFIWMVGYSRKILFKCISTREYKVQ